VRYRSLRTLFVTSVALETGADYATVLAEATASALLRTATMKSFPAETTAPPPIRASVRIHRRLGPALGPADTNHPARLGVGFPKRAVSTTPASL
jgi:hypothetical protein